ADERAGHLLVDDDLLHPGGGALTALDVFHSRVPRLASEQPHRHRRRHANSPPPPASVTIYGIDNSGRMTHVWPNRSAGASWNSHHGGLTRARHPDINCAPRRGGD